MGKCCGCCPCRCKKKKNKDDLRPRSPSMIRNLLMARNTSNDNVPSITALAFNIPATDDHKVISLENLPMSIDDIEEHYSDIKNVYMYAVETMNNFLGKPCYPFNTQPKQLYPYIKHICEGLEAHEYTAIKDEIAGFQLSNIQVSLMIKDAKLIHPKMTDFSQIFCKVWITDQAEQTTTVKEGTSSLLWDETFDLHPIDTEYLEQNVDFKITLSNKFRDVTNYESDTIHVEVWSSRPGLLERMTFTQERFKEDDPLAEEQGLHFIGDAVEYVKFLPCINRNVLWTLKKGPRRAFTTGQLNLCLRLGTKKTADFMLHLYCHITFIRLCYEKRVLKEERSHSFWKNWLEILPNEALTLIQQHAIQHGMSPAEQCLCSWLVTLSLKMRREDRISFYLLKDLMEYLFENVAELEVGQAKDLFIKSITDFSTYSLHLLKHLHNHFDLQDVEMADELFYLLSGMVTAELRLRTNYMDSFEVLEEESNEWYLEVIRKQKNDLQDDESVETLCNILKDVMKIYLRNQIVLDNVFMRAWNIRYTAITYKKLDHVVCETILPMIKHIITLMDDPKHKTKSSESLLMLQLYYNVRNVVNYVQNIVSSQSVLSMSEYSAWFGEELVLEWFLLCDFYTSQFIQRAVLADSMDKLNPKVYHGTSVPDVISIIDEMVIDVWTKLKWEDQFYTHGALIEATKSCIVYYSKNTLDRLEVEKFFCQFNNKFEVSEKLCVAISNMHSLSEYILRITKKIKKEFEVAESALGFKISQPLLSVQSEMQIMTSTVILLIVKKISDNVRRLIREAVTDSSDKTSGQFSLYLFMDTTLSVMYSNLTYDAFYIVLRHMWVVLLYRLSRGQSFKLSCFLTKKKKMKIYMVYLQVLRQMKTIFLCDGHGLTEYEMENKLYEELKNALEKKLAVE